MDGNKLKLSSPEPSSTFFFLKKHCISFLLDQVRKSHIYIYIYIYIVYNKYIKIHFVM